MIGRSEFTIAATPGVPAPQVVAQSLLFKRAEVFLLSTSKFKSKIHFYDGNSKIVQ
jgi:hypothetical protein